MVRVRVEGMKMIGVIERAKAMSGQASNMGQGKEVMEIMGMVVVLTDGARGERNGQNEYM